MNKLLTAAVLGAACLAAPAHAEEVSMPNPSATASEAAMAGGPVKGDLQAQVLSRFGEPTVKHPTVGGTSPQQPPITRWDYPAFTVVFEHDHVVDTVVHDAPAPVFDTELLTKDRQGNRAS